MISPEDLSLTALANFPQEMNWTDRRVHQSQFFGNGRNFEKTDICYRCGNEGHKSTHCQEKRAPEAKIREIQAMNF